MSGSSLRWLRRIAIGAAVLLVAGFGVGSLAGSKRSAGSKGTQSGSEGPAVPAPAIGGFAVENWMLSPGHRANILNPEFQESAIGVFVAADGTVYLTQEFIRR